jgi:hypothetical protein
MNTRRSSVLAVALLAVLACLRPASATKTPTTNLLFPFLTNVNGFDTLFTVSNTGSDPFGTAAPSGSCVITFYENGVGTAITIPGTIQPGQTATFLVSVINPGFNGYAIAHCTFAFAHGIERLSDIGTRNLTVSYPALVVPEKRVKADEHLSE